jgi:hypothetical protein
LFDGYPFAFTSNEKLDVGAVGPPKDADALNVRCGKLPEILRALQLEVRIAEYAAREGEVRAHLVQLLTGGFVFH